MKIEFSEIYQPLFDLLEARNIVNSKSFTDLYTDEEKKYWLRLSKVDTVLMSGGRDSGKTFCLSCFNCIAAKQYNHRILYTRYTMSSTDNSITEAIDERLDLLNMYNDFEVSNKTYRCKNNDGKIVITGQKTSSGNQTAKLKSLEDFSIFETDEGEELVSYEEWKKIKRSMRSKDVQCLSIIVFNPPTTAHWLYDEFYQDVESGFNGIKGKTLYIHSTYLDNGKENMAEHNWEEYEDLRKDYETYLNTPLLQREKLNNKLIKNYKEYKYRILGGFKEVAEGVVFENWRYGEFNPNNLQTSFGQDYGFTVDPTTLIEVAIDKKHKKIYVKEHLYKHKLITSEIIRYNKQCAGNKLIIADSAEPRLIDEIRRSGCNIRATVKGAGSINAGVSLMQDYEIIVSPCSTNIGKELNNYAYSDKKSNLYIDDYNHAIDAIRYNVAHNLMNSFTIDIR